MLCQRTSLVFDFGCSFSLGRTAAPRRPGGGAGKALRTQAAAVSSPSPPLLGSSRRSPRTRRGGRWRGGGGGAGGGADEGGGGWGGLCWRKRPPVDSAPHRWGPAEGHKGRSQRCVQVQPDEFCITSR